MKDGHGYTSRFGFWEPPAFGRSPGFSAFVPPERAHASRRDALSAPFGIATLAFGSLTWYHSGKNMSIEEGWSLVCLNLPSPRMKESRSSISG